MFFTLPCIFADRVVQCQFFLQRYALSQQNTKYDENEETDDDETGNEYGDVNDRSHEGEEFLDQIDYYSFRIFPIMFALANIPFWLYYLPKHMENCEGPKP